MLSDIPHDGCDLPDETYEPAYPQSNPNETLIPLDDALFKLELETPRPLDDFDFGCDYFVSPDGDRIKWTDLTT